MQKAKEYVDQSMTTIKSTVGNLQQALNTAEKEQNKQVIQQAINSLNSVCNNLTNYKD